jgi:glycosyltransferase involved in cell wall biosynthesis
LLFDALISLHDSIVWDRKRVSPGSYQARKLYYIDLSACRFADIVLVDTEAHIEYFSSTFGLPRCKFRRLWVGADDEVMFPRRGVRLPDRFTVFFYGSFSPLHGVEYIVEAAYFLQSMGEEVDFVLVGSGQTLPQAQALVKELGVKAFRFIDEVPYEDLPVFMSQSHICLGIFGTTAKAQRVIPNKVFDAIAVGRPVITGDTPAIREAFTHGKDIYLCPTGDGRALAEAILALKQDPKLRAHIAKGGYELFRANFSIDAISRDLVGILNELI